MKRVSFQGERGAYSEAASVSFFGNEVNAIPCSTFADALKNTENDTSDYSVLPVENSLEGSVGESNDLLLSTKLNVVGEIYHRIHHCLIGTGSIGDIDTIYSHPQALGQCRQFIQKNSLKTIPSYDTAGSVKIIKDLNKNSAACIASKQKINLTKIESRPNKNTAWEYNFYVDFEGHQDDSAIKDVLQKLRGNTTFLKILGSYPIAKLD